MILAGSAHAETISSQTLMHTPPLDTVPLSVDTFGRVAHEKSGAIAYSWPLVTFSSHFTGSEIWIDIDDSKGRLNVYIDGNIATTLSHPGASRIHIKDVPENPRGGDEHSVSLTRFNETQDSVSRLIAIYAHGASSGPPSMSPSKSIEFIGDSYTVGYGNTSSKRSCTAEELDATTDTGKSFAVLTADAIWAKVQVNAYSGRGIVRNYNGFAGDTLPDLYPYALFDGKTEYHDPTWQPQVIVIALGTNDFSTPLHAGEKWKTEAELIADYEATYVNFVKSLRTKNPDASVLLISYDPATTPQITTVRDRLRAAGETRVDVLEITGFTKNACDHHPDTDDDRKISQTLIAYFDAHPELWPDLRQGK
ncbi:hypothetical protein ABENE_00880 [Asticcacaulis benevestitus DSM 16100 = ATCC BAA-896]|uniref:GDSL family lipase n=2 Tax=Asticcacaulis TaxID=76890 RepID=V4Q4U6_9CAUL|nr:hypothetical protein ABENE_00880 [Asticcacaulis benevestitus DSM 16100 = ATCC BAA-896]